MEQDLAKIAMHTVTGKMVRPFAMTPDQVEIEAIAHHLSTQARWNGATHHPHNPHALMLSVAEHSVNVANHVGKELKRPDLFMQALLHDATEAYVPDLIRPLKHSPAFYEPFKELEDRIWLAVAERFGLPETLDPLVKVADDAVCWAEWQQVVPHDASETWGYNISGAQEPAKIRIAMWEPSFAKRMFLGTYASYAPAHGLAKGQPNHDRWAA
ncbi:hypothetical protein [Paracoccus litorisediminis]|uniref:HD domain-containing protein n=1 Tax=Paracoccus litorisediminis TaxID=2006130 RepID=A0A844HLH8_9RHOB|nr:hypothetical protein [Paracoccus litorisediminis]MTH61123.1 hypothetical protein [Paracoccus litorisediminis]